MRTFRVVITTAFVAIALACGSRAANAQSPDLVLVNGKVVTVDAQSSLHEALAIRDGKILALGRSAEIRRLAGPDDARRRSRRPHRDPRAHRLAPARDPRGALVQHRGELDRRALARRSARRASARPRSACRPARGSSSRAAGTSCSSPSGAGPTQAELEAAAPDNPVYVQLGYGWVVMTDDGFAKLGITSDADLPAGGKLERDGGQADGRDQRRAGRDHRAVRSAAEADVRGAGRRARRRSSASSIGSGSRASSIPAATTCSRPTTRRCSTCGGAAS